MDKEEKKLDSVVAEQPLPTEPVEDSGATALEESSAEVADKAEELSGREAILNRFRAANADFEGDPTDDDLYGYAESALGEGDSYREKYDGLNSANEKLAEVIREEPSVARFIGMIANGSHPMYAVGKCFGDIIDTLDDDSLEELERGMGERKERAKEVQSNFETYGTTLKNYLANNGLTDEDGQRINDTILDIAEALTMGLIDEQVIDSVYKGLDYDNKREDELNAAKLAGKNEAIDAVKDKRRKSPTLPPDVVDTRTDVPPGIFNEEPKVESLSEAIRKSERK